MYMKFRLYPDTTHGHIQGGSPAMAEEAQAGMGKKMILPEMNLSTLVPFWFLQAMAHMGRGLV